MASTPWHAGSTPPSLSVVDPQVTRCPPPPPTHTHTHHPPNPLTPHPTPPPPTTTTTHTHAPAGYETVYKGKFHLTKPGSPSGNYTQADLAAYGYARWNPPDAGADQSLPEGGGNPLPLGEGNNDFRCAGGRPACTRVQNGPCRLHAPHVMSPHPRPPPLPCPTHPPAPPHHPLLHPRRVLLSRPAAS